MISKPRFLQGVFAFEGAGLDKPVVLHPDLTHVVPAGVITQPLYFRGGNATDELVALVLMRDGVAMRWFPLGARDGAHVQLAVVEDLPEGTTLEVYVAAREGLTGTVVVDLGLVEV